MSGIAELMRESPAYKKAVLAIAVTAGVGACVYFGYRCSTRQGKGGPQAPRPRSSEFEKKKSDSRQEKQSIGKEEQVLTKTQTKDIELDAIVTSSKVETVQPVISSPHKADELSTSGTFEKISLAANESDNFEHLTLSQVNPSSSLTQEEKGEMHRENLSSSTVCPPQGDSASASILNPDDMSESISILPSEQSVSFITTSTAQEEVFSKSSEFGKEMDLSKDDDSKLLTTASGVKLKDENDIVVVETDSDDSSFEKGLDEKAVHSAETEFNSSQISPVFGFQSYQRVSIEPDEAFDPAKRHPASIGFKFVSDV